MTKENIAKLLSLLGAKNVYNSDCSEWVKFSCLFAKYTHKSGKDSSPSAGIKIGESNVPYHCFSCGESGAVESVLMDLLYKNKDAGVSSSGIAEALQFLENASQYSFTEKVFSITPEGKAFSPFPEAWLGSYLSVTKYPKAMAYLEKRRVPLQVILDFDIRFDNVRQAVCFPYRNSEGVVAGMRGRIITEGIKSPHHDYSYNDKNNTALTWFRESELDPDKPLVVTEGAFDAGRVYQNYRNVTAILSAFPTAQRFKSLLNFPDVVWFSDNDMAGKASVEKARAFFKESSTKFVHVVYNEGDGKDPDSIKEEALRFYLKPYVGDVDPLITFSPYDTADKG